MASSVPLDVLVSASISPLPSPTLCSKSEEDLKKLDDVAAELPSKAKAVVVEALSDYPDGGFTAWFQIGCCCCLFFTTVGAVYSWGVMQSALFQSGLAPVSTLAFVGTCQTAMSAFFAIPCSRLVATYGPRKIGTIGALIFGLASILAGSCTHNIGALAFTEGFMFGIGQALCFFSAATLPSSYFLKRRNIATGIVYAGAGVGGALLSLLSEGLLKRVGIPWTFRITGFLFLAVNIPAALCLRGRLPLKPLRSGAPIVDWVFFKDLRFTLVFVGGAISVFPLLVAPFLLPIYSTSIGLSAATASQLVAAFNLASAAGRITFGFGADRMVGSVNSVLLCLTIVGISTLVIWPVATTLAPLAVYAVISGFCSGGFFSLVPGLVSALFGSSKLPVVFGMIVTSWAPGYLLGAPIAGYILQASGPESISKSYQPAMFYSGATSLIAAFLILGVRIIESRKWFKVI